MPFKFTITLPDGKVQTFTSPVDLTDDEAYARAVQESGFASGRIPTSFGGGFTKALAEDPSTTGALMGGAGMLTGTAPIVAAAPLAALAMKAISQGVTGRSPSSDAPYDTPPVGIDDVKNAAIQGAVQGYGPQAILGAANRIAGSTVAHQLPSGQWVAGLKGHGVMPWLIREGSQAASDVANATAGKVTPAAIGSTVRQIPGSILDAVKALIARLPTSSYNFP